MTLSPATARFLAGLIVHEDVARAAEMADIPLADAEALLQDPEVAAERERLTVALAQRALESEVSVIARLANWAEGNIVDYLNFPSGVQPGSVALDRIKPKDLSTLPVHMQKRVKKLKVTKSTAADGGFNVNWELELHDAMKANEALARILDVAASSGETPEDLARSVSDFIREMSAVNSVKGGKFPEDVE